MTAIQGPSRTAAEGAVPQFERRRLDARPAGAASRPSRCRSIPTPRPSAGAEARLRRYPPLVFAGEARKLKGALAKVADGRGLPAAGRRLRRELRRVHRQQHPRHLPRAAADGGRADLRRRRAGGEGRPHGRPVRQAALVQRREDRRRRAAVLSRRQRQRLRVHRRGAHARSRAHGAGLQPVGRDAQPAARLRPGRLRRPARGPPLEPRLRAQLAGVGQRYHDLADAARRDAELHGGLRPHLGDHAADRRDRLLHQPRGAAAALRGGADPRRFDLGRLVRLLGAHAVDRRSHPPARRRAMSSSCAACAIRSASSAARRCRARRTAAPDRHAEPGQRARPHRHDRAHGRRQGGRRSCRRWSAP